MASGDTKKSSNCATGTQTMSGSAVTLVCGFKPKVVRVLNTTNKSTGQWNDLMPDAAVFKTIDSGVGTTDITYATTNGITPTFNGFTIGTDASMNNNNDVVFWEAYK